MRQSGEKGYRDTASDTGGRRSSARPLADGFCQHEAGLKKAVMGTTYGMRINFKDFLATVEGLLLPDRSSVPGKSRLNTSIFPRTRYKANPNLLPPAPRLPKPRAPRIV
jgi:hypothetical protein